MVEGVTRTSRRLAVPSASDSNIVPSIGQDAAQPTFKSRGTKRHEETSSQSNIVRTRTRTRVEIPPTAQAQIQSTPKNERFDSRRTRTRSQPALTDLESNKDSTLTKDTVNRSRSRAHSRRPTLTTTTLASVELTSPASDESKLEIINSNLDDITKIPTEAPTAATEANQFRRRNIPPTTESVTPQRSRGRINTRPNVRSLDLAVSGTINTLTKVEKTPTTARSAPDLRNSKKLRYRTRPSETDTNLTGKGLLSANEVIKSSQNRRSGTSQEVTPNTAPVVAETIIQQSTETNEPKTTTTQVTKVIKRPVPSRRNANFRPTASLATVSKVSDEISEDDNYPASFKALIQAKNASTQVSSPTTESLSLKGSQKVHKTYSTTSSHSTLTGPSTNKFSRWRTKQAAEEPKVDNIVNSKTVETTPAPEVSRSQTYKPRGTYAPRNRKSTFTPSSTRTTTSGESSSEKSSFKYSRKLKVSTTELPKLDSVKSKSVESSQEIKKPFVRPPFNLRKSKGKNESKLVTSNETTISGNRIRKESLKPLQRPTLPRTSFYTKTRNLKTKNDISSTMDPLKEETTEAINKKSEENVETPFVFALLNNSEAVRIDTQPENKDNHMFLIAVTSKESLENTTSNEVTNTAEESENKPVVNVLPIVSTKQESDRYKYHSNYKDQNLKNTDNKEKTSSTVYPLVRNLQTRKYGRNRTKSVTNKDVVVTSPKTFRTVRKFSESFSKTTEASNNGITPEPEKTKNRFSSKYRASYLDKPFYKPTVPTITPSTVEGEEIQLGPDLNAISFTQTRRTLDSADLRLSESLVKPSHVMNVEASHHSPSVTISIFDALAEILTSTPRPRLSSTTEMTKIKPLNTDVKQVLNGVSNNVNVNSVRGLVSQDTFVLTNADVSTTTKTVQPTVQTPNVINSILVEGTVTQSLNTEDGNSIPVNTLQTSVPSPKSTPTPTTPVSARKPFAIRILYSDTESSTDKLTTASQPTQGSTDNPKTVYNSVSDLLLSNNNLVSSELTSMLSNNIKNIIENMDENSRSKLNTVDMNKFLRTLIPRALNGLATALDNADAIPNTTPYSLDDIKDTENIVIDGIESNNVVQNVVTDSSVNITVVDKNVNTTVAPIPADVNSPVATGTTAIPSSESNRQVTTAATATTVNLLASSQRSSSETTSITVNSGLATSPASLDTDSFKIDTINDTISSNSTNNFVPVPFFTNSRDAGFSDNDDIESTSSTIANPLSLLSTRVSSPQDVGPNKISPLQLWVLSKKAQVLKMIEDLIRQHNTELATAPPLTDLVRSSDTVNLSDRLSDIVNTMISSTSTEIVTTRDIETTSPMTTASFTINPLSTVSTETTTSGKSEIVLTTNPTETTVTVVNVDVPTTTEPYTFTPSSESFENNSGSTTLSSGTTVISTASNDIFTSTSVPTTNDRLVEVLSRLQDSTATTTPISSAETTTTSTAATTMETTTQATTETSTTNLDITTAEASDSNTIPTTINTLNIGSSIIPKKDYVIFGILPNNTVVRKDPNQDILETLTEASPYIIYGILPNNTVIRKFPNGTRVPRVMQKIDILPISPWSLRNPYSPIHNNPAIVRPQSNPIRVSTNTVTSTDTSNNGTERLTNDTVNNQQTMTKQIRTEKPGEGDTSAVFKFIPIDEIMIQTQDSNVLKLSSTKAPPTKSGQSKVQTVVATSVTEINTQTPQIQTQETTAEATTFQITTSIVPETTVVPTTMLPLKTLSVEEELRRYQEDVQLLKTLLQATGRDPKSLNLNPNFFSFGDLTSTTAPTTTTQQTTTTASTTTTQQNDAAKLLQALITNLNNPTTLSVPREATKQQVTTTTRSIEDDIKQFEEDTKLLQALLQATGQNPANLNIPSLDSLTTTRTFTTNTQTIPTTTFGPTTTTVRPTTTTTARSTTTVRPTTTESIEDDLRQFQEDTKLLQALLQATGQNPQNLNIPIVTGVTSNPTTENVKISTTFQPFNQRRQPTTTAKGAVLTGRRAPGFTSTTEMPSTSTFSVEEDLAFLNNLKTALNTNPKNDDPEAALANRIIALAVEKSLNEIQTGKSDATRTGKNIAFQEDTKLLQALLKATGQDPSKLNLPTLPPNINDVQETTTQKTKLTITGQSADEALKKLVRQQKPSGMVSEATQSPISLSTEYGKSNDALLAALLKEQGFGPTTASSLDEQLRLSALLNQVVVTPKARRTTTPPPPPPPAPRRPILDGLAWLWQQWRETAPGSGPPRPGRGPASAPAPSARPSMSSTATSNGASWLGSGPFVGNADDTPANRIPLEPPRSVASEQTPGRGQLVSAAINVTRAFSQFLGAAIQGAAQTVQSVIRAGQRAASDVYVNGSGGSG
ncbi:unnamed protein product [Arctia plantaginis]|uniref:Uncharacterized protein n=1 Tax=Arctia plantaginis TaxID=874455 RepID=A0A8S0YND1_ARCPL|nr:unnamed protein product [Arctia plantaginis]